MIPKEAISRAIEGGWKSSLLQPEKLVAPHWYFDGEYFVVKTETSIIFRKSLGEIALDPEFWKCLGKALGWRKVRYGRGGYYEREVGGEQGEMIPIDVGIKFCALILTGGDTEKFWEELLTLSD